ncbi:ATP synthase subunit C lysine N-methyltransferase isoform 3-T3 [Theristicus caerulescens]
MSKALGNESHAAGPREDCEGSPRRSWGLLVTAGVGGTLVALYAVATPFVTPALRKVCLPFVPATATQIQNVLKMLENRSGSLVDIGSGDGRIVIAAAKRGFKAVGYELNPWLVWYSRYRAWRDGVHQNTRFYISDLWKLCNVLPGFECCFKVSFSRYKNVVVFGVPQMMPQLEKKLQEELEWRISKVIYFAVKCHHLCVLKPWISACWSLQPGSLPEKRLMGPGFCSGCLREVAPG